MTEIPQQEIHYYEFMSPFISERASGTEAVIEGITLRGPVTRNMNLYTPRIKREIAKGLIGQPILFGAPRDHVEPNPEHDIYMALSQFKVLAAKYIVGHITEAYYNSKADAIFYKGTIRNTTTNPDVVDLVLGEDLKYTSIGGIGKRMPMISPHYGAVNEVVNITVTHMSFVAIPGDPDSYITKAFIKESFDPTNLEEVKMILENAGSGEEGQNTGGNGSETAEEKVAREAKEAADKIVADKVAADKAAADKKAADKKAADKKAADDARAAAAKGDSAEVYKGLLDQITDIRQQRNALAKKLGLSEQERKALEDESELRSKVPTKEQLDALEKKLGDVESMRSEIARFKKIEEARIDAAHLVLVEETVALMKFDTDTDKVAKIEELKALDDNSLTTLKTNIKAESDRLQKELAVAKKNLSTGRVTLFGTRTGGETDFQMQYKELTELEKNSLWELWVRDSIEKVTR